MTDKIIQIISAGRDNRAIFALTESGSVLVKTIDDAEWVLFAPSPEMKETDARE